MTDPTQMNENQIFYAKIECMYSQIRGHITKLDRYQGELKKMIKWKPSDALH